MPVSEAVAWLERNYDKWRYEEGDCVGDLVLYRYWPPPRDERHELDPPGFSPGVIMEMKEQNGPYVKSFEWSRDDVPDPGMVA